MGSSTESAGARAPQRQRGKIRVAAIMSTAMELFTEKGYDATTMTEIAERSTTAIGSLYRFFPSKESLADALLFQFAQQSINRLAELELQAGKISMAELAKAFVAYRTELSSQRSNALSLVDARGTYDEKRLSFREALRSKVARVLRKAIPTLTPHQSYEKAVLLLHILRAIPVAMEEKPATRRGLRREVEALVLLFLRSAAKTSGKL